MSIATYLTALDRDKDALAANLVTKGVQASSSETFTTLVPKVLQIPGGSPTPEPELKDVMFYDYDGTVVASYTKTEFADLPNFPTVPTHTGLVSGAWNWNISDAKSYVNINGKLDIGAYYDVLNGGTYIDIEIDSNTLTPYLRIGINGSISIDWGDNSALDTLSGDNTTIMQVIQHIYSSSGKYRISIMPATNTTAYYFSQSGILGTDNAYARDFSYINTIVNINTGSKLLGISQYFLAYHKKLKTASIYAANFQNPTLVHCFDSTGIEAFVIPPNFTLDRLGYTFQNCLNLKMISTHSNLTFSSSSSQYCFNNCPSLKRFCGMSGSNTKLTRDTLSYDFSLKQIVIPEGITTLDTGCLQCCGGLEELVLPASLTSIGSYAIKGLTGLKSLKFKSPTPPTLGRSDSIGELYPGCVIYVPQGKLSAYTSAQYYPSSSTYTYVEY